MRIDLFGHSPGILLNEREVAAAIHVRVKTLQYWRQHDEGPPFLQTLPGQAVVQIGDAATQVVANSLASEFVGDGLGVEQRTREAAELADD